MCLEEIGSVIGVAAGLVGAVVAGLKEGTGLIVSVIEQSKVWLAHMAEGVEDAPGILAPALDVSVRISPKVSVRRSQDQPWMSVSHKRPWSGKSIGLSNFDLVEALHDCGLGQTVEAVCEYLKRRMLNLRLQSL
ncbi:hypothetical protein VNO80_02049 [Phaseolus coccineus]|uniref:Uncharacterized protein n=1 Tax=Phaseolus coccineus TaxID=3886 RepID=A0AAN9RTE9_PHACN